MTIKLDFLDKQIIDLLTDDGRMTCAEIARRIGQTNERLVRYRLERLIKEGVFVISAVLDAKTIGFPVIADVFIEVEPGRILEVANKLAEFENITYVACSIGERDVSIQIVAQDNRTLYDFVSQTIGSMTGVRRSRTSIVPIIIKDDSRWKVPSSLIKKNLIAEK
ncbi:MAG TPA: Lrp/AsnC ligand binding domain-containing protein [Anaerolineaceae bacterium]|nr:Lrp/AsnC ligand binding domain-containing protein [Anaerolineaceae bacterium]